MDIEVASGYDAYLDRTWSLSIRSLDFAPGRHALIVEVDGFSGGGGGAYDLAQSPLTQGGGHNVLSLGPGSVAVTGIVPTSESASVIVNRRGGASIDGHVVQLPDSELSGFLCFSPLDGEVVQMTWDTGEHTIWLDLSGFK